MMMQGGPLDQSQRCAGSGRKPGVVRNGVRKACASRGHPQRVRGGSCKGARGMRGSKVGMDPWRGLYLEDVCPASLPRPCEYEADRERVGVLLRDGANMLGDYCNAMGIGYRAWLHMVADDARAAGVDRLVLGKPGTPGEMRQSYSLEDLETLAAGCLPMGVLDAFVRMLQRQYRVPVLPEALVQSAILRASVLDQCCAGRALRELQCVTVSTMLVFRIVCVLVGW